MVFVFDLDDTLSETDKYSKEYISKFFAQNNLGYKQIKKTARFAEQYFDWDKETALKWYKQYGDEMMLHFPCKKGTTKVINKLHELGHKIVIATARATDWHIEPEQITIKWLKENNIPYDKLYVGRIDKEKICEEENADVFVDDDISITTKVAEHFENNNNKDKFAFVVTTKYNKNLAVNDKIIRAKSLKDMVKILRKLKKITY